MVTMMKISGQERTGKKEKKAALAAAAVSSLRHRDGANGLEGKGQKTPTRPCAR